MNLDWCLHEEEEVNSVFCELSILQSNPAQSSNFFLISLRSIFFGSRGPGRKVYSRPFVWYVTKINLTAKAWEKAIQELGKMSTKIAWHSPKTLRYESNQKQRGEYFKVTSYKTVEFSFNHAVLCYLLRNVLVALHFKMPPFSQKISNFGDNSFDNFWG